MDERYVMMRVGNTQLAFPFLTAQEHLYLYAGLRVCVCLVRYEAFFEASSCAVTSN